MLTDLLISLSIRFFLFDFVLFKRIRNYLKAKGYFFRKLFGCPFCQGFWCGLGVYLATHSVSLDLKALVYLFIFGLISGYLSLAAAVILEPLIIKYERNSGIPLK